MSEPPFMILSSLLLADSILVLHFAFVLFVVGGQVLVTAGGFLGWRWVRNPTFRVCHLLAIGWVVAQAWLGEDCPLTVWEQTLRRQGGQAVYEGSFLQHWVHRLMFFDAPLWVFTVIYTGFGLLVLGSWFWVRPGGDARK